MEPRQIRAAIRGRDVQSFRDLGLPPIAETPPALRLPAPPRLPEAADMDAAQARIAATLRVPRDGHRVIQTPDGLDDVEVRHEYLRHIATRPDHRERWANRIEPTLSEPLEVWLAEVELPTGRKVLRRRFFTAFDDYRETFAVAQENKDSSLLWTFLRRIDADRERNGFLLYRREV